MRVARVESVDFGGQGGPLPECLWVRWAINHYTHKASRSIGEHVFDALAFHIAGHHLAVLQVERKRRNEAWLGTGNAMI